MVNHRLINASGDLLMHTRRGEEALAICWQAFTRLVVFLAVVLGIKWITRRRS